MASSPLKTYYNKPTQKRWRKIGDALLYSCSAIGGGGLIGFDQLSKMFTQNIVKGIVGFLFVVGLIGKFMSNFFKQDDDGNTGSSSDNSEQK